MSVKRRRYGQRVREKKRARKVGEGEQAVQKVMRAAPGADVVPRVRYCNAASVLCRDKITSVLG